MLDGLIWFFTNIAMGFVDFFKAVSHPMSWLDWSEKTSVVNFIYYGASHEFFFVIFDIFLIVTLIGLFRRKVLWAVVRGMEGFANTVGRFFAYAGLVMVVQQIIIIFLQRIFRVADVTIGPFGYTFTKDLSWFSEELKLYNAMIVALCVSYTFVQGGHVRVDLVYGRLRFHGRRIIDMLGSLFFILPVMTLVWTVGWFYLWRALVTPPMNVTYTLDKMLAKGKYMRWNVETIGFSPNGFDAYFLFKILLIMYAGLMFLQGIAFFYRSLLEYLEGPESEDKFLDKDKLEDELAETVAAIH